jgi:uncharacterized protein (TIGR03437 family)
MKRFRSKALLIIPAIAILAMLTPLNEAQVGSSITQVTTLPPGLQFSVDNTAFTQPFAAIWPAGSKHVLDALPIQYSQAFQTQFTFSGWEWSSGSQTGTLPGGLEAIVTADPSISSYHALYATAYSLQLVFSSCPSGVTCPSPGTVYVNGAPYVHDAIVYVAAGSAAVMQAYPSDGYIFTGWGPGLATDTILGFQKTVVVNQPTLVYPQFQVARNINLASVPSGLQVLADRSAAVTPVTMQWGFGSVHTLGAVSPQQDLQGNLWVFSSWSDGGASTHGYTVAPIPNPDTVTATFVPGALATFATDPVGLNLNIDGRTNWPTYNFTWGIGETHTVAAPSQQTDAQGHIWSFSQWSNGGAASQSVTVPPGAATAGLRMTATYTPVAHLTVNSTLPGVAMTVNGSGCSLPCDIYQPVGTQVDIGAPLSLPLSPGSRQDFASWSVTGATGSSTAANGDLLVTLGQAPVTVTPVYHLMNNLTLAANPTTGATFSLQPSSPDGYYDSQSSVTVKASPLPGYKFRSWSGDLSGLAPTGSITMAAPRAAVALLDSVPYITPSGVVNGASVTPQAFVAPGSVVSVFGANMASTVAVGPSSPLVQTLGGVTARIGSQMVALYFVSPTQINFQLPADLLPGPQTVTISSQGLPDATATFQVATDAPGLFPTPLNGVTFGLMTHSDGSPVTPTAPAQTGETLLLYGTGFGPTQPSRPEGFAVPASPQYVLTDAPTLQVGGVSVTPTSAYALAGAVGVDVLQFVVPDGLPSGTNSPVTVTINGATSNTVQLAIQ